MSHRFNRIVDDAESEASTSSFDSGEEPDDESDLDYDPDRQVVLGVGVVVFILSPVGIYGMVGLDSYILYGI